MPRKESGRAMSYHSFRNSQIAVSPHFKRIPLFLTTNRKVAGVVVLVAFLIAGVSIGAGQNRPQIANFDEVSIVKRPVQRGSIIAISSIDVTMNVNGKEVSFPVNEIGRVRYDQEPMELNVARHLIAGKQYDLALKKLNEIKLAQVSRDMIVQDIAYYKAYLTAKIGLEGGGDKDAASAMMSAFVSQHKNNYHYFAALEVLGDLAVVRGQYDGASRFYGEVGKAPWPSYKLHAAVLEGHSLKAQKKYIEALERYESVIGASDNVPGAEEQKHLATLGKMAVLVALNRYPEKSQAPDAELHVMGQALVYVDACCWDFDVAQFWGAPANIMYIDAQVTTAGVTVTNANGPAGTQSAVVLSNTSLRWYMPTPDGLWNAPPQTVTACFDNVPATGATLTLTGYDSAGNTQPLQQTSVTFAEWGDCGCMTDLWMKDTMSPDLPEDFGAEPNMVSQYLWISRDIWIRTNQDSLTGTSSNPGTDSTQLTDSYYANEHQHQNPVYVNTSTPSFVYVKVRNRGCGWSQGTSMLYVYWADASTGLPWPGSGVWNAVGSVSVPNLGPMKDYVVELPWVPPNPVQTGTSHYCLVARIETVPWGTFGMTFGEGPSIWQNVRDNNNIVWKNVTVLGGAISNSAGSVIVRNPLDHEATLALHFAVPERELRNHFLLHGDIFVDLGKAIMKKWRKSGQPARGFTVVGPTTIKITDPANAGVGALFFGVGEAHTIKVRMQLKRGEKVAPGTTFNWDVIELAPLTKNSKPSIIGGERYVLSVPTPR